MTVEALVIPVAAASLLLGLAVARWWVVLAAPLLLIVWVASVAVFGGGNIDGMPDWLATLYVGAFFSLFAICGLVLGVVWGKLFRERRSRTHPV